jgi:hypothetical protein
MCRYGCSAFPGASGYGVPVLDCPDRRFKDAAKAPSAAIAATGPWDSSMPFSQAISTHSAFQMVATLVRRRARAAPAR